MPDLIRGDRVYCDGGVGLATILKVKGVFPQPSYFAINPDRKIGGERPVNDLDGRVTKNGYWYSEAPRRVDPNA